jgi:hypothetical protein
MPEPARERADVLGVRLRAASEARARRQWQDLLGGRCSMDGRSLVFRWEDSPLAVTIELDAAASEGPLGIEIATPRALRFPGGGDRALGTRWLRASGLQAGR